MPRWWLCEPAVEILEGKCRWAPHQPCPRALLPSTLRMTPVSTETSRPWLWSGLETCLLQPRAAGSAGKLHLVLWQLAAAAPTPAALAATRLKWGRPRRGSAIVGNNRARRCLPQPRQQLSFSGAAREQTHATEGTTHCKAGDRFSSMNVPRRALRFHGAGRRAPVRGRLSRFPGTPHRPSVLAALVSSNDGLSGTMTMLSIRRVRPRWHQHCAAFRVALAG